MATDKFSTSRGNASLSDVVRSVVRALSIAQRDADMATLEQIAQVGLERARDGATRVRTIDFGINRPALDGTPVNHLFSVPILSLAPPSQLTIKTAEVSFDFEVTEITPSTQKDKRQIDLFSENGHTTELMGYVIKRSDENNAAIVGGGTPDLRGISIKLTVESPPISSNLGQLLDQIANSASSKPIKPKS